MWALQFTLLSLTKRPNGTEKAIKEKLIMSFFKNLFSKTKVVQSFNSEMMIETAIKWTVDFMTTAQNFPEQHIIKMRFICFVLG